MSNSESMPPPLSWRQRAACRDTNPARFYPEDWDLWDDDEIQAIKDTYCDVCPVKDECLDFAIGTREIEGIWGGMTHSERKSYIRRQRKEGVLFPKYSSMGSSIFFERA